MDIENKIYFSETVVSVKILLYFDKFFLLNRIKFSLSNILYYSELSQWIQGER